MIRVPHGSCQGSDPELLADPLDLSLLNLFNLLVLSRLVNMSHVPKLFVYCSWKIFRKEGMVCGAVFLWSLLREANRERRERHQSAQGMLGITNAEVMDNGPS